MAREIPRRSFLQSSFAAAACAALPRLRWPRARTPNILFILADDLGYGDLSCYGRPDYRTPHIDRLALEGLRFTSNYTAAAVCTPTRVGLMTGRFPARLPIGLMEPLVYGDDSVGLPPEHPTPASLLKAAGYETALIGKWHLGFLPEHGPIQHGFDEFYGILGGGVDYFSHRAPAGKLDLHEGNVTVDQAGYMTDLLTERAVRFVRRRHTAPFYLALHYTAPHWPWEGPGDSAASRRYRSVADTVKNRYVKGYADGGSLRVFAAMMQRLDDSVGRLLRALEDAGQSRDTFVVFTSDNGGERYSFNWPTGAGKGSLREGGIRVPAIVRWPGRVPRRPDHGRERHYHGLDRNHARAGGRSTGPGLPARRNRSYTALPGEGGAVRPGALLAHPNAGRGSSGPLEVSENRGRRHVIRHPQRSG